MIKLKQQLCAYAPSRKEPLCTESSGQTEFASVEECETHAQNLRKILADAKNKSESVLGKSDTVYTEHTITCEAGPKKDYQPHTIDLSWGIYVVIGGVFVSIKARDILRKLKVIYFNNPKK